MTVGIVEPATGLQELRDDLSPTLDIGQPAGGAPGDIDEVERSGSADSGRRVIEIGADETHPIGQPQLVGEAACSGNRRLGEIEARHRGAALGETERVGAEMAL